MMPFISITRNYMLHIEWVEVRKQKATGWLSTTHEMPTGAKKNRQVSWLQHGNNPGIWQWQHNRITRTSKLRWKGWMKDKAIKVMQHESTWCNMLPSQLLRFLHISRYHHVRLLVMSGFSINDSRSVAGQGPNQHAGNEGRTSKQSAVNLGRLKQFQLPWHLGCKTWDGMKQPF